MSEGEAECGQSQQHNRRVYERKYTRARAVDLLHVHAEDGGRQTDGNEDES
jgi:hypothetical protein